MKMKSVLLTLMIALFIETYVFASISGATDNTDNKISFSLMNFIENKINEKVAVNIICTNKQSVKEMSSVVTANLGSILGNSQNTLSAIVPISSLYTISQYPDCHTIELDEKYYQKFTQEILDLIENENFENNNSLIRIIIMLHPPDDLTLGQMQNEVEAILNQIESTEIISKYWLINGMSAIIPVNRLPMLESAPHIMKVHLSHPVMIALETSKKTIKATTAWNDYGVNGTGVNVAVIDTGIDFTHPNIGVDKRVTEHSWFPSGEDQTPDDLNSHGTHVAGIVSNTHTVNKGIAPGTRLLNAKVMNRGGGIYDPPNGTKEDTVIEAIEWSIENGADVISMSLRVPHDGSYHGNGLAPIDIAVENGAAQGITLVVAAGNAYEDTENGSITNPGNAKAIITVGATRNDYVSDYNNRWPGSSTGPGGGTGINGNRIKPEVMAPGCLVTSTNNNWETEADFIDKCGTSMAAPHVSGVSALLLEQMPNLHADDIKAILMASAYEIDERSDAEMSYNNPLDYLTGAGIIDIHQALGITYGEGTRFGKLENSAVGQGEYADFFYEIGPNVTEISFAVVWLDPTDGTSTYHNDLDVQVFGPEGLAGQSQDIEETVEFVTIKDPAAGIYHIEIYGYSVNPIYGDQQFSLAISNKFFAKEVITPGEEKNFGINTTELMYNIRLTFAPYNSEDPQMVIDSENNVHIVWVDLRNQPGQEKALYYKKLDNDGNIIVDDKRLTTSYRALTPSITIDSNNNVHIVWLDIRDGDELFYKKLDNNGNTLVEDRRFTDTGYFTPQYPSIVSDGNNNMHITWHGPLNGITDEIFYTKLDNNGNTLVDDTRLTFAAGYSWEPRIATDSNNNVHITWLDFRDGNAEIYYTKLNNNGGTLVDDTRLTNAPSGSWAPDIVTDSYNYIHISWYDERDGNAEIYYTKLNNNGGTLVDDTRLTEADGFSWWPSIDIDGNDNIHIAWFDARNADEIYYIKLDNDGNIIVDDKRITYGASLTFPPFLAIDHNDYLHFTWNDYVPDGGENELFYTKRNNNGNVIMAHPEELRIWSVWESQNVLDFYLYDKYDNLVDYVSDTNFVELRETNPANGPYRLRVLNSVGDTEYLVIRSSYPMPYYSVQNSPPELEPIGDKEVNESELLEFTVSAFDPDEDELSYWATGLPVGANFDPVMHVFSWTPTFEQAGIYPNVCFYVSDSEFEDYECITITVYNVNRPPELEPIGDKEVNESEPLIIDLEAVDADDDMLLFGTNAGDVLPSPFTFDAITGIFEWTPTFEDAGEYEVIFNVTDGELSDEETITITVNNINRAPLLDPIGNKEVREGQMLVIDVAATDPDNDTLTYYTNADEVLPSEFTFDPQTGLFEWTPSYYDAGEYYVTFNVTDDGLWDFEEILITVLNFVPQPPKIERYMEAI